MKNKTTQITYGKSGLYLAIFIVVVECFIWSLALYQEWDGLYRAILMVSVCLVSMLSYAYWKTSGTPSNLALYMGCITALIACGLLITHGAPTEWIIGTVASSGVSYGMSMLIIEL
ncbi:hypothetical protein KBC03_03250 [Patescibacteria group bacterium]|nr:hypothetical protein [Patescibacteria group bacterium]